MSIEIVKTEDSVIKYSNRKGYYIEDRRDVCNIECFNIEKKLLRTRAAINAIQTYKENNKADQSLLEELLS